jgi:hypothetical protein
MFSKELKIAREKIGHYNQREEDRGVLNAALVDSFRNMLNPLKDVTNPDISNIENNQLLKSLSKMKSFLHNARGYPPTAVGISAAWVQSEPAYFLTSIAEDAAKSDDIEREASAIYLASHYDAALGMSFAIYWLIRAEDERNGKGYEMFTKIDKSVTEQGIRLSPERYAEVYQETRGMCTKLAGMINDDPSPTKGLSIFDYFLERPREVSHFFELTSIHNKERINDGIKCGRDLYEFIYPLAEYTVENINS